MAGGIARGIRRRDRQTRKTGRFGKDSPLIGITAQRYQPARERKNVQAEEIGGRSRQTPLFPGGEKLTEKTHESWGITRQKKQQRSLTNRPKAGLSRGGPSAGEKLPVT